MQQREEKDGDVAILGNGGKLYIIVIDIFGQKEYIKGFFSKCILQVIFIKVMQGAC